MKKLKWNFIDILKKYISCDIYDEDKYMYEQIIRDYITNKLVFEYNNRNKNDINLMFKTNVQTFNNLTKFQKQILKNFLNSNINNKFIEDKITNIYNNDFNFIKHTFMFVDKINPSFKKEFRNEGINNRIYIDRYCINNGLYGLFYPFKNNVNYYYIKNKKKADTFISLNHELGHGMSSELCENINNNMYDEALSILIELLANDFEYNKKLINKNEYIKNYNNVYLFYAYKAFEESLFLFNLIEDKKFKNVKLKIYKDEFMKKNHIDKLSIKDALSFDLEYNLSYMYSLLVAISVYDNYKNNPKEAVKVMLDILKNVRNKEENIFKFYNIDIENSINKYIDNNITMQIKRKMK